LEMRGITKRFPGIIANDGVDLDLRAGEIHGLLGENGAGKTTLMNILYGLYRMDDGEILVDGERASIRSPRDASSLGIGMIHQFSTLVRDLTVLENVILGREPSGVAFIDLKLAEEQVKSLMGRYSLQVDLGATPEQLTVSQRQKVEILKALYRGARILIMDEPTSVLSPQEKAELMAALRGMVEGEGLSIIFITHKLPEAIAASDRITVLRKGRVVGTMDARDADPRALALMMVGRETTFESSRSDVRGKVVLEVDGVEAVDDTGRSALGGVSLQLREGEILGLAGVSGNGQEELVEVITGLRPASSGRVTVKGKDVTGLPPRRIRALGVGYVPEDRMGRGVLPGLSVEENLVLGVHGRQPYAERWFLPLVGVTSEEEIRGHAEEKVAEYGIETPNVEKEAGRLSGGNIQKLILARELSVDPDILIAEKPTAGLDVGSQEFIHRKLTEGRDRGMAVLLISEDLDEILALSDRVAVIYEGVIVDVLDPEEATRDEVGALMAGLKSVPGAT
jgi:ABC-type uncharacterized transport system ATPase subunit